MLDFFCPLEKLATTSTPVLPYLLLGFKRSWSYFETMLLQPFSLESGAHFGAVLICICILGVNVGAPVCPCAIAYDLSHHRNEICQFFGILFAKFGSAKFAANTPSWYQVF